MQKDNQQEKEIERSAGDKLKGFTLQKQRALSLFFDNYKLNPQAWVSCAIEYEGDVYCTIGEQNYIEEQKNYHPSTGFSFNSHQVLNTLVYFLHFWLNKSGKSSNCRFGFYSTNSISKENKTSLILSHKLVLPEKPIIQLLSERNYDAPHLLPIVKKLLCLEYRKQYKIDIETDFTENILLNFLQSISFYTDQKNEEQLKEEVIQKIRDCHFCKYLNDPIQAPLVYDILISDLEKRQNNKDVLQKFVTPDVVEKAYLRLNSREYKAFIKQSEVVLQKFDPVPNYISRTVSLGDREADVVQYFLYPDLYPSVYLKECITESIEALRGKNKFILYSSSQWGKSTELKHLGWQLQQEDDWNVYLYEIKNYPSSKKIEEFLLYWQTGQKIVLLVDGIDETKDNVRSDLFKELEYFAQQHPEVCMILSCRSNFRTATFLQSYHPLYLNDLSWPDAIEYIKKKVKRAPVLIKQIEKEELISFTSIPFFLTTLIDYFEEKNKLPTRKFDLYEYWIKRSFQVDDSKCRSEINEIELQGEHLLQKIAVVLQLTEKNNLTERELSDVLGDAKKISLCRRFTVLERNKDNTYAFGHNAFKEYFVAMFLLEKGFDAIVSLSCYRNENKIKPLWYNVIVLLLSHLTPGDQLANQIIDWLKKYNKELLLHMDPRMLDITHRIIIFKEIILFYKEQDMRYSDSLRDYKNLISFGFSVDSMRFILDELKNISALSPSSVNLYEILLNLDYNRLSLLDPTLLHELEDVIYSNIEAFKDTLDNGFVYYLYLPFDNKYFHTEKHVKRLYTVIKDCNRHNAIKSFLDLLVDTGLVDKYIPYLLEKEKYVANYYKDGVTHMVSRYPVFKAFENVREFNNLITVFPLLESLEDDSATEKENILQIKKYFLQQLKQYAKERNQVLSVVQTCYLKECGKHYSHPADYLGKNYQLYKDFYNELFPDKKPLYPAINELKNCFQQEERIWGQIDRINLIIALFIDKTTIDSILENIDIQSETDYIFMNCIVNPLEKELYNYTKSKVDSYFSHFRIKYPDYALRSQQELDLLFNYPAFKEEILRVVEEKQPVSRKDLKWEFNEQEDERINQYVSSFFKRFHREDRYDLDAVRKWIQDKPYYESFLLSKIAELFRSSGSGPELSLEQKEIVTGLVKKEIDVILIRKQLFKESYAVFKLLLYWNIPLEEEKLIGLLPYSDYEFPFHRDGDRGWIRPTLFDRIKEEVNTEIVWDSIFSFWKEQGENRLRQPLVNIFSKFIIENEIEEGYSYILQEIKCSNGDPNHQWRLIELILKLEEGKDLIKHLVPNFILETKLFYMKRIISAHPEEYNWIEQQLIPAYREYPEEQYREAVRILIHIGNREALTLCKKILSGEPYYFGYADPVFNYTTADAIPDLCDVLAIVLQTKRRTEHMDIRILYALETIAIQSRENLQKVISGLRKLMDENKAFKFLNYSIRDFTNKYYETSNDTLSIKEALKLYEIE